MDILRWFRPDPAIEQARLQRCQEEADFLEFCCWTHKKQWIDLRESDPSIYQHGGCSMCGMRAVDFLTREFCGKERVKRQKEQPILALTPAAPQRKDASRRLFASGGVGGGSRSAGLRLRGTGLYPMWQTLARLREVLSGG